MTKPEEGLLRMASSKIKGKDYYKCDAFQFCSGVDLRYAMQLGLQDFVPIQKGVGIVTDRNMEAAKNAGFRVVTGSKIDYVNDDFARGYLSWGLHSPEEIEKETRFALERISLPLGKTLIDIGCGNGVSSVRMAEMGYDVAALDISSIFIDAGRKLEQDRRTAGELPGSIDWICCDYFDYQGGPYDAAILLDSGLDVANERFINKLCEHVKPGGHFFLRYKQGFPGNTNWPWYKWSYNEELSIFSLERHTVNRMKGSTVDEWITIDLAKKEIAIQDLSSSLLPISQFIEMMASSGFVLSGAWGNTEGSQVSENSRVYAHFVRLPERV